MNATVDNFWEQAYRSGEYRKHWDYSAPSQELVALVAAGLIAPHARVLDVGCGSGREAVFLAECGCDVAGVDISPRALELARRRAWDEGVEVEWLEGSFFDLPVEDMSVDFINDRGALHLVAEKSRPRYAAEVRRVLKPGGCVLIRGAGPNETGGEHFTPVTEESIDRHFPPSEFRRGPVLPITLISDGGTLDANIVVLHKRSDS